MNYFQRAWKTHFRAQCCESCCQFSFTIALGAFPTFSLSLSHWCMQFYWIEYVHCYLQWICTLKCKFSSRKLWTSSKRKYIYCAHWNIFHIPKSLHIRWMKNIWIFINCGKHQHNLISNEGENSQMKIYMLVGRVDERLFTINNHVKQPSTATTA